MTATSVGRSAFMSRTRGREAVIGRGAPVDTGLALATSTLALLPWMNTFDGMRYLLIGTGGAILGIGCGLLGLPRGRMWVAPLSVAALYVLLAGMFVADSVLPTGTAVLRGIRLSVTGWKNLLTTVPPVDSTGPLVVLPLLCGLVTGSAAVLLARRSHGPWVPVVPAVLAGILTMLTGTRDGWHPMVAGTGVAVCAVSWAALRRRRRLRIVGTGAGARAQISVAAALLVLAGGIGWAVAPHLPGADRTRFVARDLVDPPFDVNQYPSPLLGFRKYGESMQPPDGQTSLHDQELLAVSGLHAGSRVRFTVLDYYTGSVWSAGSGVQGSGGVFQRVGRTIRAGDAGSGPVETATLTVRPAFAALTELNPWVPGVGPWSRISFGGPRADDLRGALRYNTETGQGLVPNRLRAGDVVTVTGAVLPDLDVTRAGFDPGSPTLTDSETTAFADATAQKWLDGQSAKPPLETLAVKLKTVVRAYTDGGLDAKHGYLPGHSAMRLTRFLNAKLASPDSYGSDEQFAAAYALLANSAGVPARVVIGAIVPDGGAIRGRDVRAWVEVRASSGQWYAVPNSAFEPGPSTHAVGDPEDATNPKDPVLVPPPAGQPAPGSSDALSDADPGAFRPTTSGTGATDGPSAVAIPAWVKTTGRYAGPPAGLLAAVALLAGGARGIRRRRRRKAGPASRRLAAGWRDLTDHARDLGIVVPAASTRREQAEVIGHTGLAAAADRAVFGAGEPDGQIIDAYWNEVRSARRMLSRGVPWYRRVVRAWRPSSFLVREPRVVTDAPTRGRRPLRTLLSRQTPA